MNNTTLLYDDFEVNHCFSPTLYSVSAQENDEFLNLFTHTHLQAGLSEGQNGRMENVVRPVHPILVGSFQPQHAAFAWPTGVLHAKEKISLSAPVYPGESLEARIRVKDKYLKNEKKFIVFELTVRKLETSTTALVTERTLVWPA